MITHLYTKTYSYIPNLQFGILIFVYQTYSYSDNLNKPCYLILDIIPVVEK